MPPLLNAILALMRLLLPVLDQWPVDDGEEGRQWRGRRHGDSRHPGAGGRVQVGEDIADVSSSSILFRLYGYKWFSSATDSDMSMSLARVGGGDKLSMFFLKTRDETGKLNNIQVTLGSKDYIRIDHLDLTKCLGCENEEQARDQAAAHCRAPPGRDGGQAGGGGGARHREHHQHAHHHQAPQHSLRRVRHEVGEDAKGIIGKEENFEIKVLISPKYTYINLEVLISFQKNPEFGARLRHTENCVWEFYFQTSITCPDHGQDGGVITITCAELRSY